MIVDCHTHLWKAENWSEDMAQEAAIARARPAMIEIDEDAHWLAMKAVDRAIVFGFRAQHAGLVVPNELIASYVAKHPEKLIGFACIDPNEPNYLEQMHQAFEDLELRGLKLAPIYQNFHPMDDRLQPVYAYCEENHLPVIVHQGATFSRRAPLKYALPIQLEEVAMRYPNLKIVIAHMGHPWIDDTVVLIRKQPNVYADISALHYRPWQFYNGLISAIEYGAVNKLLFGSDYPFTTPGESLKALRDVNHIVGHSGLPRVSDDVISQISESNSTKLLGL
jgi:predicted TIM-barrel fold metal-dependent hydrolase